MTYGELCKAIRAHRGKVFACVNAAGCQFHIEAKKGEMLRYFQGHVAQYGVEAESDLEVSPREDGLYLDTVVPE
jgi:hypothetical protein